jgi:hypothetical protein
MSEAEFWKLIEEACIAAGRVLDVPKQLIARLKVRSPAEIIGFEEALHAAYSKAFDLRLWAAATLVLRYCSDDVFYDFRGWLIAQGQAVFEKVLNNPESLAEIDVTTGDDGKARLFYMASVASKAYAERTRRDLDEDMPRLRQPTLLNEGVWNGEQKKLPEMFPRLFAKYGMTGDIAPVGH